MARPLTFILLAVALATGSCASRTTESPVTGERLASASVTFATLEDGKDADSAVTVQLLRNRSELAAETVSSGTAFDDDSIAAPIVMTLRGPFERDDAGDAQLRLRLTPDGDDTWTFDLGLTLRYADGREQRFNWEGVQLDEDSPERTLVLSGAASVS